MNLVEAAKERILITAHRGVSGGNIPCNTMAAYEIAVRQGADMIEIDANMTSDGHLVILHPKMEPYHLGIQESIRNLTLEQVKSVLRYVSGADKKPTEWQVPTLDEVLDAFKGRCFINIDKFWEYPIEISKALYEHKCLDQIVVKTSPKPQMFDIIEEYAHDIPYLPIFNNDDEGVHEYLKKRNINYIGAELVFNSEDCAVVRPEFLEKLKKDNKLTWCNAILYNYRVPLAAGHSDDISLVDNPDLGWGWIADKGFDIIQTDWPLALSLYLDKTGRRFKNK